MINDSAIRVRVAEELSKLPGTNQEIAQKLDCTPGAFVHWKKGRFLPGTYYLANMYRAGCDVMYILTGERTKHET